MTGQTRNQTYFDFNFPALVLASCCLPLGGLLVCEAISLLFHFEESTSTICDIGTDVQNFLPSISEATGRLSPQKYIWNICIALHATPRFVIATGYHNMHKMMLNGSSRVNILRRLTSVTYVLHSVEILALLGLSFVSSTENYEIHKFCFVTFLLCATFHMISMCVLRKKALELSLSQQERISLKCKMVFLVIYCVFLMAAMYFFHRHNTKCEDGVYSLFALCEIVVVVSNIGFHGTAFIDFRDVHFVLQDAVER